MTQLLLITRPHPSADHLAASIKARVGEVACLLAPVMEIVPLHPPVVEGVATLLLTSRHAVPFAADHYPNTPALCVGEATAAAARHASLPASAAEGTADDLVPYALSHAQPPVLHLRGAHTRGEVARRLNDAGLSTQESVVYDQAECAWPEATSHDIHAAGRLIVPVFSPRTSALTSARLRAFSGQIAVIAISQAAADSWDGPTPTAMTIASHPTNDAMISAIASQIA